MGALTPGILPYFAAGWDALDLWGFEVHVSVLVGCVYLAGLYLIAVGPGRERWGWGREEGSGQLSVPAWRKVCFLSAVGVIFLALNGPLHTWSDEYLFSAHMVQHMLLMLLMPPLLILGLPPSLIRQALRSRAVYRVARFLTHPLVAYTAYNVVFIGWHLPANYNRALESHAIHIVQHLSFMAVAVMMWWPVVNPVRELERIPTGPLLMMYVFAFGIPSTVVAALITLSDQVIYPWYGAAPRITGLSPLEDQRLGGLIMWVPGMLIFWLAISVVYFRWTRDEFASWRRDGSDPSEESLSIP